MAINNIATATLFQKKLDKLAIQSAVTGWTEPNAKQVVYNGGSEIKIPKMSLQGLADYDRENGYTQGAVTLEYETRTMTQDRGRKFELDSMVVDESNFIAQAGTVMSEFQTNHVVPEIDAYRLSKIASTAIDFGKQVEYGYTPDSSTIIKKIKEAIAVIRDNGYNGELLCHISHTALAEIEYSMLSNLSAVTFANGGVNTKVPGIDGVPFLGTPQNRLYTAIKINDGKTSGQEIGGYTKADEGLDVNFIIVARNAVIAPSKQDKMRIFDPNTYQKADAWAMDYRRFHDCWIPDNKQNLIFANIRDAKA